IRNYLPAEGQVFGSEKYALGPQGFLSAAKFLDRPEIAGLVNEVGFERDDAEAMFAQYHSGKGEAVLLLIEYPTPQLAEQHLHHDASVYGTGRCGGSGVWGSAGSTENDISWENFRPAGSDGSAATGAFRQQAHRFPRFLLKLRSQLPLLRRKTAQFSALFHFWGACSLLE